MERHSRTCLTNGCIDYLLHRWHRAKGVDRVTNNIAGFRVNPVSLAGDFSPPKEYSALAKACFAKRVPGASVQTGDGSQVQRRLKASPKSRGSKRDLYASQCAHRYGTSKSRWFGKVKTAQEHAQALNL